MSSFWMPKKQPLYAPMLSTFGGGSVRGFRGSGGSPAPWEGLQTGDTYQGGTIQNNGSSMGVYWYVTPRTINTLTTFPSSLTTTFTVEGQSAIRVWLVGGGSGSHGSNGPAGGGGGAISSSGDIAVSEGSQYNIKVGHGGCLGFNSVNSDLNPAYFPNSNYSPTAGGESRMWPVSGTGVINNFDVTAYGGGAPAPGASNTSTTADLGQGGTSAISNTGGLSWVNGTGGRGGGRNFVATNGTNGGAGGGGGQQDIYANVKGGNGSGLWGGSGGAGNHYEANSSNTNSGYPANTTTGSYAYPGGSGGSVYSADTGQGGNGTPTHGQNGSGPGGGYAVSSTSERQTWYYQSPLTGAMRGSAGGGGFPGGAGGSAVWGGSPSNGGAGFGADGASGIVYIQWAI